MKGWKVMTIDTCIVLEFYKDKDQLLVNSPLLNKHIIVPNCDFIGEYFESYQAIESESILIEVDIDVPEIV